MNQFGALQGQALVVGYMGDGINDVAALHVADVGIGVGPQEAIVAAPFRSLSVSATGVNKLHTQRRFQSC